MPFNILSGMYFLSIKLKLKIDFILISLLFILNTIIFVFVFIELSSRQKQRKEGEEEEVRKVPWLRSILMFLSQIFLLFSMFVNKISLIYNLQEMKQYCNIIYLFAICLVSWVYCYDKVVAGNVKNIIEECSNFGSERSVSIDMDDSEEEENKGSFSYGNN